MILLDRFDNFQNARVAILIGNLETSECLIDLIAIDPRNLIRNFQSHRTNFVVELAIHSALVDVIFVTDCISTRLFNKRKFRVIFPSGCLDLLLVVSR